MVIVRDIEFASTSETDLLPFYGRCHVAYVPKNGVVLGLSKLARVTKLYAQQLQSQQRLTSQILVALQQDLAPVGAAIVMEARHLAHGPEASFFMTSASSGCFQDVHSSCMQVTTSNHALPVTVHECSSEPMPLPPSHARVWRKCFICMFRYAPTPSTVALCRSSCVCCGCMAPLFHPQPCRRWRGAVKASTHLPCILSPQQQQHHKI